MLPSIDAQFLESKGFAHAVQSDSGMMCVLINGLRLPAGLSIAQTDLLLRLSPGYPDVPPDMWWFSPHVFRADGSQIPATESIEVHLGRSWQRWSRHFAAGQWMAGVDSLESYFALIMRELDKSAVRAA